MEISRSGHATDVRVEKDVEDGIQTLKLKV